LVKITANGEEVMRIYGNYKEISDIAIDPNSTDFWVADKGSHTLFHYNQDGELLLADSGRFIQPTALAIDVESGFLWVADLPSGAKGRMRRYLEGPDSLSLTASDTGYSGPISDLSMDQFKNDLLWFSVPEADEIGLIRNGKLDTLFGSGLPFNRPKHISWDTQGGKVWIADSSSVYLSDTTGIIQATITGFSFISGISSGQSGVCIADARNGEVYQFKATITGNLTKSVGVLSSGFLSPEDVSVVHEDGSCWFVDSEMGVAIRLSSSGEEMYRLYGFKQPTVISVHQGVE
jgi:DNA-binding beta-propeller fold protein YncE